MDDSLYRTAPVDQAIHTIRTWTEAPWPLTWANALRIRDNLGWVNSPTAKGLISTNFGFTPDNGSMVGTDEELWSLRYRLTDAPLTDSGEFASAANQACNLYLQPLHQLYGPPSFVTHRAVRAAEWTLTNGVGLTLGVSPRLVQVSIESPQYHSEDFDEED